VEIVYDPGKVGYRKLLDVFWRNHDPLAKDRQFCDSGNQYRPGVFYHDEEQRKLAEETKKAVQMRFAPRLVHTEVTKATTFYKAEDYHQDYYKKNPIRYLLPLQLRPRSAARAIVGQERQEQLSAAR
jgi:peptide-methionine (S)-S-oxide reductase